MTTDRHEIDVGGIAVEVVRKAIKNLHVGVYPPLGRVRVAAPQRLDDEAVRLAVVSRLGWIRRKQREFAGQDRQSQREMVTGESHYFQGRRYRLDVNECQGVRGVRIVGNATIELSVEPRCGRGVREQVMQRWYRSELRALLPALLAKWEPRVGKTVRDVRIKRMRTRWGSCNADAGRIWLNLELIKKPIRCLEFVLVHEMVHLHERQHTERFRTAMDNLLPSWRMLRRELNRAPLAHADWEY